MFYIKERKNNNVFIVFHRLEHVFKWGAFPLP